MIFQALADITDKRQPNQGTFAPLTHVSVNTMTV